jgi:hypothetical protein
MRAKKINRLDDLIEYEVNSFDLPNGIIVICIVTTYSLLLWGFIIVFDSSDVYTFVCNVFDTFKYVYLLIYFAIQIIILAFSMLHWILLIIIIIIL